MKLPPGVKNPFSKIVDPDRHYVWAKGFRAGVRYEAMRVALAACVARVFKSLAPRSKQHIADSIP